MTTTPPAMPETLLPCPLCDGNADFERPGTQRQSMIIVCQQCGLRCESGDVTGLTDPKHYKWNRRESYLKRELAAVMELAEMLNTITTDLYLLRKEHRYVHVVTKEIEASRGVLEKHSRAIAKSQEK